MAKNRADYSLELQNKATQLASLLTMCHGIGKQNFEDIGPAHRDNIIWLAADLAHSIDRIVNVEEYGHD